MTYVRRFTDVNEIETGLTVKLKHSDGFGSVVDNLIQKVTLK